MVTFHFKNSADTLILMWWLTWPIILPTFLQVVLDITFYEENKLVDQEFPEDTSPFKIQQLLQDLTEPEVLAGRLVPAQEVLYFSICKRSFLGTIAFIICWWFPEQDIFFAFWLYKWVFRINILYFKHTHHT